MTLGPAKSVGGGLGKRGSGNKMDNPTRQMGRVFLSSRPHSSRAIHPDHPCYVLVKESAHEVDLLLSLVCSVVVLHVVSVAALIVALVLQPVGGAHTLSLY